MLSLFKEKRLASAFAEYIPVMVMMMAHLFTQDLNQDDLL